MRVLDLYCGVGGATVGYDKAFGPDVEIVGVDWVLQPHYPHAFVRADVRDLTPDFLRQFDFVHASPPCQARAAITLGTNQRMAEKYPDFYPETKSLLERTGVPYVIENPSARPDLVLCGEMFGLSVIRHRKFELGGWVAKAPVHKPHRGRVAGMRHGVWYEGPYFAVYGEGGGKGTVPQWQSAMGIHWTSVRKSIAEAIPPAYTEYVGQQFISQHNRNKSESFLALGRHVHQIFEKHKEEKS